MEKFSSNLDYHWDRLTDSGIDMAAKEILLLAGYCIPDIVIPESIFHELFYYKELSGKALKPLFELGLIRKMEKGIVISPEIAEFSRKKDSQIELSVLDRFAENFIGFDEKQDEDILPKNIVPVINHLKNICQWAEARNINKAGAIWRHFGDHLFSIAEFKKSRDSFDHSLILLEGVYELENLEVANTLFSKGKLLQRLYDLQEAKQCFERSLELKEKYFGKDHLEIAKILDSMGQNYSDLGLFIPAKQSLERSLFIKEKIYGKYHGALAGTISNLWDLLSSSENPQEVLQYQDQAERITWNMDGCKKTTTDNKKKINRKTKHTEDPKSAHKKIHNQALRRLRKKEEDLEMAESMDALMLELENIRDLNLAKRCAERSLFIKEKVFGKDHFFVANSLDRLADIFKELHDYSADKQCQERSLIIKEKIFGLDSNRLVFSLESLGYVNILLSDLSSAKQCFERGLKIVEKESGILLHEYRLTRFLNLLGLAQRKLGELEEAKQSYERCLAIEEKIHGKNSYDLVYMLKNIGEILYRQSDLESSILYYERALILAKNKPSNVDDRETIILLLNSFGKVLSDLGHHQIAKQYTDRADAIREEKNAEK
ncbi:MAG: tetratricopeptide repeat protein [Pelolinea sp.]|nr:tetratricopeptide repeat protein [Pelolinea sp.]